MFFFIFCILSLSTSAHSIWLQTKLRAKYVGQGYSLLRWREPGKPGIISGRAHDLFLWLPDGGAKVLGHISYYEYVFVKLQIHREILELALDKTLFLNDVDCCDVSVQFAKMELENKWKQIPNYM